MSIGTPDFLSKPIFSNSGNTREYYLDTLTSVSGSIETTQHDFVGELVEIGIQANSIGYPSTTYLTVYVDDVYSFQAKFADGSFGGHGQLCRFFTVTRADRRARAYAGYRRISERVMDNVRVTFQGDSLDPSCLCYVAFRILRML